MKTKNIKIQANLKPVAVAGAGLILSSSGGVVISTPGALYSINTATKKMIQKTDI